MDLGVPGPRCLGPNLVAPLARRQELAQTLESLEGKRLGVEDAERLRLAHIQEAAKAEGVLLAADDYDAVVEAAFLEPALKVDGRADDLDPLAQERLCIALGVAAALGQERDPCRGPKRGELGEQARHARVARAAVGIRDAVVDHEEAVERLRVAGGQHLARLLGSLDDARPRRQPLAPAIDEEAAVSLHRLPRALRCA